MRASAEEVAVRISTVLFILGVLVLLLGGAVIGFGIPVSEFSFGNTLIIAGALAATGGLVVIALSVVVGQLQRLNEAFAQPALAAHAHERAQEGEHEQEAFAPAMPGAVPEPHPFEPRGPSAPPEFPMPAAPAPTLRNPEEPVEVAEEVSLSPQGAAAAREAKGPREQARGLPAWMRSRPTPEPAKDERKSASVFDSMWPPENKMFGGAEKPEEPAAEPPAPEPEPVAAESTPAAAPPPAEPKEKPRAIAILKSGVVDGMGYTLYVDGSIEAELPQGTLRFASIHELRAHLEQNNG